MDLSLTGVLFGEKKRGPYLGKSGPFLTIPYGAFGPKGRVTIQDPRNPPLVTGLRILLYVQLSEHVSSRCGSASFLLL